MADITISAGTTISATVVNNGDVLSVYGTGVGTTVNSGGSENVYSGGLASSSTVSSGGTETVYSGGMTYGDAPGGLPQGTMVLSGGVQYVSSGGFVLNTAIRSGGVQYVSSGGLALNVGVDSGAVVDIRPGGVVSGSPYLNGGQFVGGEFFVAGVVNVSGSAAGAIVDNGGVMNVFGGGAVGTADGEGTIYVGFSGAMNIYSGGVASRSTIDIGGSLFVLAGGEAHDTEIANGSRITIQPGGLTVGDILGDSAPDDNGSVGGGFEYVSGGTVSGTEVFSGSLENIYSGGIAAAAAVHSSGMQNIYSGGLAGGTAVYSSGLENVFSGGIARETAVYSGGLVTVAASGVTSGTAIGSGGRERIMPGGVASGTAVGSGGTETVSSGGITTDPIIIGPGALVDLQAGAIVSGGIGFSGSGGQLEIDGGTLPANTISGFVPGDTIDLTGIAFDNAGTAVMMTGNALQVEENGSGYTLNLDPTQDFSGFYFKLARDSGNGTLITEIPDDFRNAFDDTSRPLGSVAVGGTASGDIETVGDKDVFAVTLSAGNGYRLSVDGSDVSSLFTLRDPKLRLLDSSGRELAVSDDISSTNWSAEIDYKALATGTYYLETTSSPFDHTYTAGTYRVDVAQTADDYRDTFSDTSLPLGDVTVGGSATGTIETNGDKDVFAVTLTAGAGYIFDLGGSDISSAYTLRDPALRLLDSAGNVLASSDDISGTNWSSEIGKYTAPVSGTYYLEAASSPIDHSYTTGTYRLDVSQDDYRDTYNVSGVPLGSVAVGGSATGTIETLGDKDVFAVTLTAGQGYSFNLDGGDVSASFTLRDPVLRLLDSVGHLLVSNDDISSSNWSSKIDYKAPASGTYYLEAASSPFDQTYTTGTYRVDVAQAADDYRDTFSDASPPLGSVAVGGSATGTIETAGDKDVFAVTLVSGSSYTFDLNGSDVSPALTLRDPALHLLDSNGNVLAASDDIGSANWSSEIANYTAASSGTYYLEASSSPSDHSYTTGTYRLDVFDPPAIVPVSNGDQTLAAAVTPEIFDFSSLGFGNDTIAGFDTNADVIRLNSTQTGSYAVVQSDTSAVAAGTLIAFDASRSITLNGVTPGQLTSANFQFV